MKSKGMKPGSLQNVRKYVVKTRGRKSLLKLFSRHNCFLIPKYYSFYGGKINEIMNVIGNDTNHNSLDDCVKKRRSGF